MTYVYYWPKYDSLRKCLSDDAPGGTGEVVARCASNSATKQAVPTNYIGWQRNRSASACAANATARCGDGVVNRALGEECDDGNNQAGDGCDPYCRPENDMLCYDAGGLGLESDYTCSKRPAPADTSHWAAACSMDNITYLIEQASAAGFANLLSGLAPLGECANGPKTCDVFATDYDPKCRAYLRDVANNFFCCSRAGEDLGFLGGFLVSAMTQLCGTEPLDVDSTCSFCGDGQRGGGEACDDANNSPGDGCSQACSIESRKECFEVDGLSLCADKKTAPPTEVKFSTASRAGAALAAALAAALLTA